MLMRRESSLWLINLAEFAGLHQILARSLNMRIYACHVLYELRYVRMFMKYVWTLNSNQLCGCVLNEKIHGLTSHLFLPIRSCITRVWLTVWRRGKMGNLLVDYMALPYVVPLWARVCFLLPPTLQRCAWLHW